MSRKLEEDGGNGERRRHRKNTSEIPEIVFDRKAFIDRKDVSRKAEVMKNGDVDDNDNNNGKTKPTFPRLILRNLPFFQSKNKVSVIHNKGLDIAPLLQHDWFHVFLRLPSKYSITIMLSVWTGMVLAFAGLYIAFDNSNEKEVCRLGDSPNDIITFGAAFAFSVETCTTVGYGLPSGTNAFFEGCQGLQVLIYLQMIWSMLFNAFLFAFLYNRIGRSESRGAQVVQSKNAIVTVVNGQIRLQSRIYDIDARHPVVEAHVRLYVVMKERPVPRPLRLLQPNDELGGMLFLSFPTVVTHHIDVYSLLYPPDGEDLPVSPAGLILRQVDSATANREDCICPICSESYGTHERWAQHVRYMAMTERMSNFPVEGSHQSLKARDLRKPKAPSLQECKDFFEENVAELIFLVEGIDPLLSGTFQALHSYRFEDIIWQESVRFSPCIQVMGSSVEVDLDRFHEVDIDPSPPPEISVRTPIRDKRIKQISNREHDSFFGNMAPEEANSTGKDSL